METNNEMELRDYLIDLRKETKYIYLQLWPEKGPHTLISKKPLNICKVEAGGNTKEFDNISESFYDKMVMQFDKRSN